MPNRLAAAPTSLPPLSGGGSRRGALSLPILALLPLALPAAAQPATSPPPGTRTECNSAGLALGALGTTRLQVFADGHGRTVELWCERRIFGSNYDLRFIEPGHAGTIAGCYFAQARNTGPILHLAPSGAYTAVEWINESLTATGTSYRFRYDVAARRITITATAACHAPATVTIAPQADFAQLERLLPTPAAADCPTPR